MTTAEAIRVSPEWLDLRERADAAARSPDLVRHLRRLTSRGPLVVHDLACGSGSMAAGSPRCCPARSTGSSTTATRTS